MSLMCKRGEYPITVPPLIEFTDGRSSKPGDGDFTEPQCRPITRKGDAAIGGAAPIPESGPLGGVHQGPELRAPIRGAADGVVSAELPFLAELCSAPVAGAIQLVQGVKPCGKQGVAPLKRSRCWFGIVRPDPHGGQNSQLWLINSCERALARPLLPAAILPFLLSSQSLKRIAGKTRRTRAASLGDGRRGNSMVEKRRGKPRREIIRASRRESRQGFCCVFRRRKHRKK